MPNSQKHTPWWRLFVSGLFIGAAVVAVLGAVITRYTRDNVISTDGYLNIVGPLPQDPQVAGAIANYTTTTIVDATDAQESIKNLLPPKLAPLAGPLTKVLQDRVNGATKSFVQSDNFNTIWVNSQRFTHQTVIKVAESKPNTEKAEALASLNLEPLIDRVRQILGVGPLFTDQQKDQAKQLILGLHQTVNDLRTTLKIINTGAYILPFAAAAFLLLAVALAYNRRKTVLGIGLVLLILGASALITFKIASGQILADVQDPTYNAAAKVIYEAFYSNLRMRLEWVMITGGILAVLALAAGPYAWAVWLRKLLRIPNLKHTFVYKWAGQTRSFCTRYFWWICGGGLAIAFTVLLLSKNPTTKTAVATLLTFTSFVAIIHLISTPSPSLKSN